MSQRVLRSRSAENVMKEIIEVVKYRGGGPLSINFTDPNFMGNPKEVDRLCDLLLKHNLNVTFHALLRADFMARNPKIVKKMCDAGILWYEMGIESPNMKDLKSTKKVSLLSFIGRRFGIFMKTVVMRVVLLLLVFLIKRRKRLDCFRFMLRR